MRVAIKPVHRWIIWAIIIGTAIFGGAYFLIALLQCNPMSTFWTMILPNPPPGSCLPGNVIVNATYAASAINAMADWTFGILPIFIVRTLQISHKRKIMVVAILAVGAV